ncbi:Gfo/Idh/MocA family oxidoreductase [Photobacterium japonica]|uniref:Gfo/Idh/MocA family protein n=1 Tax=Photobacterium japonica TaxID=2910235 RepID=UPI003D0F513B
MKIALIGLGDIAAKAHLPVLTQMPDVEWVFCTRQPQRLAELAAMYRITACYTDYRELVNLGLDAVMIHSATQVHVEIAQFFLNHGLPVFVDKPLADNYADCERLHELAARKRLPIFMGFNRRYIPLYQTHLTGMRGEEGNTHDALRGLRWEKHRHDLPGEARTFVFDDFIHPLDSINVYASIKPEDMQLSYQTESVSTDQSSHRIARIDVQWQQNNALFQASMNRLHGITSETVSAQYPNKSYRFDSMTEGVCWQHNQEQRVRLADWTPMLASKGFLAMAEHWLEVVSTGQQAQYFTDRNLHTHRLAEYILQRISIR